MRIKQYLAALAVLASSCAYDQNANTQKTEQPREIAATETNSPTTAPSWLTDRLQEKPSLAREILYYMKEDELNQIKESQDPRIDVRIHTLEREISSMPKPIGISKADFDYFMAREAMSALENNSDPYIVVPGDRNSAQKIRSRWDSVKGYKPTISEKEWSKAYQEALETRKQETGDPGIFGEK